MVFGHISFGEAAFTPINFTLYDQYGNRGDFHLYPDDIPQQYDNDILQDWDFVRNNFTTLLPTQQRGEPPNLQLNCMVNAQPDANPQVNERKDIIGINSESFVNNYAKGPALEVRAGDGELWLITPVGQDVDNPQRLFTVTSVKQRKNIYTVNTLNDPLVITDGAGYNWLLKPLWNKGEMVISYSKDNSTWSWYPTLVTLMQGSTQRILYLVHIEPYHADDDKYAWSIAPYTQ